DLSQHAVFTRTNLTVSRVVRNGHDMLWINQNFYQPLTETTSVTKISNVQPERASLPGVIDDILAVHLDDASGKVRQVAVHLFAVDDTGASINRTQLGIDSFERQKISLFGNCESI